MGLNLVDFETKAKEAVMAFWGNRDKARQKQQAAGKIDQGERSSVTAGKNMDGFVTLVADIVKGNGLAHADIHLSRRVVTLPGYFRPTKLWDLVVINAGRLVAAIELKSHVGPSFGKNFNNRTEESLGTSHDFWTAYRDGAFGPHPRPFIGWLILVEETHASTKPVKDASPHFQTFKEFQGASYLKRYDLLCQRLVKEQLYTTACVMASPRDAVVTGTYSDLSEMTSFKTFVTSLAGHVATEAARGG
jgi:hypothetical protein